MTHALSGSASLRLLGNYFGSIPAGPGARRYRGERWAGRGGLAPVCATETRVYFASRPFKRSSAWSSVAPASLIFPA